jgi:hypothetical protein
MPRHDEADLPFKRRGDPVLCPFCKAPVPRPSSLPAVGPTSAEASGGRCACGAVFLLDASGREGGQLVIEGLARLCDGDLDRALALRGGLDYRIESLGYNPRGHNAEAVRRGGFGRPKLWFFLLAG